MLGASTAGMSWPVHRQGALLGGEAGGADDDRLALQPADLQVLQRHLGGGEVDQDIAPFHHLVQVVADEDTQGAAAGNQPGILADQFMPGTLQGARDRTSRFLDCNDDALAHASGRAADGYFDHNYSL